MKEKRKEKESEQLERALVHDIGVGQIFLVEQITKSKTYKQYPTVWLLQINLGFFIVRKYEKHKSFT